jgi:predicted esterase
VDKNKTNGMLIDYFFQVDKETQFLYPKMQEVNCDLYARLYRIFRPLLFLLIIMTSVPAKDKKTQREIHESKTAVNTFKDGGILYNWVILGPFICFSKNNSSGNDSLTIDSVFARCFESDYLYALGQETNAYIPKSSSIYYKDTTSMDTEFNRINVRAKKISANSKGIVVIDSLFTSSDREIAYAFCMVETFLPCSIRCFWGIDGNASVWINGNPVQNRWNVCDTFVPLSKYFDAEFDQGMNTILIKFTDVNQRNRFSFEAYYMSDSIVPFEKNIHTLFLKLDEHIIPLNSRFITVTPYFNIPIPENLFTCDINILNEKNIRTYSSGIGARGNIGNPLTIEIPDSIVGNVQIFASAIPMGKFDRRNKMTATRYAWRGDMKAAIDSQKIRFYELKKKCQETSLQNSLINKIVNGGCNWGNDWFSLYKLLSIDEQIRQLNLIKESGNLIDSLFRGNKLEGNKMYPMLIPIKTEGQKIIKKEYDPSRWLNYKYPDIFELPENIKGSNIYRFWLYLPKKAKRKRGKMPLILCLHGKGGWGPDINGLQNFGPGAYSEGKPELPFAVVTPQCRYNTLWDSRILKELLDTLLATRRFNPKRIYITGEGMGGFTAWHMACTYPEDVTAIIPLNAGANNDVICSMKNVPVWAFHGARNSIVPFEESQKIIMKLKNCTQREVEYSLLSEHGHSISSVIYNDPRIYKWFKRQK